MAEHRTPDEPDDTGTPEGEDGVEAYESDWYRSLQAVANREGNKAPPQGGESPDHDADAASDDDDSGGGGGGEKDSKTGDEKKRDGSTKKAHPESAEPGIWVVVTPDR